jgi:hypothetical protein
MNTDEPQVVLTAQGWVASDGNDWLDEVFETEEEARKAVGLE